jgi:hypothetical protein
VLDTFLFADRELLRAHPWLRAADVLVHFQSAMSDLDVVEHWGTLGDRRSWQRMPKGVAARLGLLLGGFPAGRRLQRQPCGGLLLLDARGGARRWGADQAAALGRGGALSSCDEEIGGALSKEAASAALDSAQTPAVAPAPAASAGDAAGASARAAAMAVAVAGFELTAGARGAGGAGTAGASGSGGSGGSGGGGGGAAGSAAGAPGAGVPGAPALAPQPVAVRAAGRPLAFEPARASLAAGRRRQP